MPESDILKWASIPQLCSYVSLSCDETDGQVSRDSMKSHHPYQLLTHKYHVDLPTPQ